MKPASDLVSIDHLNCVRQRHLVVFQSPGNDNQSARAVPTCGCREKDVIDEETGEISGLFNNPPAGGLLTAVKSFVSEPPPVYQTLPSATRIASPLTPLDSSDARNAIISATSSGVTTRPRGYNAARSVHTCSAEIPRSSAS